MLQIDLLARRLSIAQMQVVPCPVNHTIRAQVGPIHKSGKGSPANGNVFRIPGPG
jgi:hypothetical protein